jgi:hypothetical protein
MCSHKVHEIKEVFEAHPEYVKFKGKLTVETFKELM